MAPGHPRLGSWGQGPADPAWVQSHPEAVVTQEEGDGPMSEQAKPLLSDSASGDPVGKTAHIPAYCPVLLFIATK